jgi:hypothetical protein
LGKKGLPKKLYRFRAIETPKQFDYVVNEIRNGYLYLSRPEDFNDSFDSLSILSGNSYYDYFKDYLGFNPEIPKNLYDFVYKLEETNGCKIDFSQLVKAMGFYKDTMNVMLKKNENTSSMQSILEYNAFINSQLRQIRIACFTEQLRNMPMWAHYANNHRGICLLYDTTTNMGMLHKDRFYKVQYRNQIFDAVYESIQYDRRLYSMLEECVITKHADWSYEKEWRLVYHPAHLFACKEDVPMNYHDSGMLIDFIRPSSIYLGWRASDELCSLMRKAVEGIDIKIIKIKMTEHGLKENCDE